MNETAEVQGTQRTERPLLESAWDDVRSAISALDRPEGADPEEALETLWEADRSLLALRRMAQENAHAIEETIQAEPRGSTGQVNTADWDTTRTIFDAARQKLRGRTNQRLYWAATTMPSASVEEPHIFVGKVGRVFLMVPMEPADEGNEAPLWDTLVGFHLDVSPHAAAAMLRRLARVVEVQGKDWQGDDPHDDDLPF